MRNACAQLVRNAKLRNYLKLLYSPTGVCNKSEICKMAASRLVEVTAKEISEIKINSVPKNTKGLCKILKQLFASGSVIIGEYSPLINARLYYIPFTIINTRLYYIPPTFVIRLK